MKIMFIYSSDDGFESSGLLRSWAKVQFGISYISAMLKSRGHNTSLIVLSSSRPLNEGLIRRHMDEFEPDVVCFTAVFSQYDFIEKTAEFCRKTWPGKFYVIGGVHATLNPQQVINGPFDALCMGEGEYPVLELCEHLKENRKPHDIQNLWFRTGDKILQNGTRDFIQDLDALPFPDRQMWAPWIKHDASDEITLLAGRGCPHGCTYCSNHSIRKTAKGRYVRMRSPENIIREIELIYANYPQRKIYLEAECIALDKKWAFGLCGKLAEFNASVNNEMTFGCNFRVSGNSVDEDLFAAFEKANIRKINIGLESGSERVRREVLKRNYSNGDFLRAASMARRHAMAVNVYNLIGIPGETMSDHMETVRVNRLCQPDNLCTSIFYPYPGTELHKVCLERGLISETVKTTKERRTAVLDLPGFSSAQIQKAYRLFEKRVYKGRFPWWKDLLRSVYGWMPPGARSASSRAMARVPVARGLRASLKQQLFGAGEKPLVANQTEARFK